MATHDVTQPNQSIAAVSMMKDALIVYFEDGKRVILKPPVIYDLPSDPTSEAEILLFDAQFEAGENEG